MSRVFRRIGLHPGFGRIRHHGRQEVLTRQELGISRIQGYRAGVKQISVQLVAGVFRPLALPEQAVGLGAGLAGKNQTKQNQRVTKKTIQESMTPPAAESCIEIVRAMSKLARPFCR